ncbi:unnamed protein product [Linum tenue]|uniref:Uncharacterized protein n=1 Tax=Linum tenue TaxID=586396 RepID=A0AAV0HK37_9ROSI|nr:unnamed protein product [Linum tenue]
MRKETKRITETFFLFFLLLAYFSADLASVFRFSNDPGADEFLNAAFSGDLPLIRRLARALEKPVESVRDDNGRTAFHYAAVGGKTHVCRFFLDKLKVAVDIRDGSGETPLHHAILGDNYSTVVYLLDNNADPNAAAADHGDFRPLHYAASRGFKKLALLLLSKGAHVDAKSFMGAPLHFAAQDKAMVSTLLNHKANPNMVVFDAFSPLMMAISLQSFDCVKLLLKGGADPNLTPSLTKLGMTPLGSAVMEGTTEIIKLLLQAGADPNKTDVYGLIPIEIAAILKNCSEAAEVLFPLTSPNPKVRNWSFDGIKEYVNSVGHIIERDMINQERFLMFKSKGKDAVNRKDYAEAMVWYSMANDMAPTDAAVLSNRSLCWARLKVGEEALNDARECLKLSPNWSKAYYRAGIAWNLLKDFQKAADMFAAGLQLDPENKELRGAFREALAAAGARANNRRLF